MKFDKLGWVVAAGLASAIFVSGFQNSNPKFANVDISKIGQDSELAKKDNDALQKFGTARFDVIRFIQQNLAMLPDDAKRYADLKTRPTIDQTAIQKIESDATTQAAKQRDLIGKPSPTTEEQAQLKEFNDRRAANQQFLQTLDAQYRREIDDKSQTLRNEVLDKVRASIKDIASRQGYSVVFNVESAPYAANDITPEVVKAVGK
ncbi:MAG TPA: OmpH family outer membrane protein [Fimbriimonas sp.]|nr:OmpH family outer membrane protein [Fimbriimonas sp.]